MDTEVISPVRQDFSAPPWLGHIVLPRSVISSFCTCHSIINSFSDHYLNNSCTHSTQTYNIDLPLVINIHSEFQYCSGAMILTELCLLHFAKKIWKNHFSIILPTTVVQIQLKFDISIYMYLINIHTPANVIIIEILDHVVLFVPFSLAVKIVPRVFYFPESTYL